MTVMGVPCGRLAGSRNCSRTARNRPSDRRRSSVKVPSFSVGSCKTSNSVPASVRLMDQLGQAVGGMMGGQSGQNPLLQAITGLLGKDSGIGGLAGLVQAFQKNGLGDIVNSWVSTGQNLPATPSQIEQGLGSDLLKTTRRQSRTFLWRSELTTRRPPTGSYRQADTKRKSRSGRA